MCYIGFSSSLTLVSCLQQRWWESCFLAFFIVDVLPWSAVNEDGVNGRTLGLAWLVFVHGNGVLRRGWCCNVCFPQFHLRLMKLSQICIRRETCKVCVPLLCLAGLGIIFWPSLISASFSGAEIYPIRDHWCLLNIYPLTSSIIFWYWGTDTRSGEEKPSSRINHKIKELTNNYQSIHAPLAWIVQRFAILWRTIS